MSSILWVIFKKKKVQFFESFFQTGSIISVSQHFCKKKFYESCWKNGFYSVSHVKKKVQFCELYSKKSILGVIFWLFKTFFASFFFFCKKRFNSVSHNFWKVQNSFNQIEKRFNSVGHIQEKGSIHWDILKKSSILRVIFDKIRSQFFESFSRNPVQFFFESIKKNSILWVMLENKKGSILRVILKRGVRFCGWKEGFNSVSLFRFKKNSILWVILKKRFNSLNHTQNEVQFFESFFQTGSIISVSLQKKSSILWVIKRGSILWVIILFFEREFNSVSHAKKKGSILWVILKEEGSILLSHVQKNQFFESYSKKGSILWVILQKKTQFYESWVIFKKRFNSLSHSAKKKTSHLQRVQFCESFFYKEFDFLSLFFWTQSSILWII